MNGVLISGIKVRNGVIPVNGEENIYEGLYDESIISHCSKVSDGYSVCLDCDGNNPCEYFDGIETEYSDGSIEIICSYKGSCGYLTGTLNANDIQSLTYRIFELIEPAIKQAITQAIEEHLTS